MDCRLVEYSVSLKTPPSYETESNDAEIRLTRASWIGCVWVAFVKAGCARQTTVAAGWQNCDLVAI